MISEASRNALEAFCSPSAAMTFARASLDASACSMIHVRDEKFHLRETLQHIPLQPLPFAIEPEGAHPFCNMTMKQVITTFESSEWVFCPHAECSMHWATPEWMKFRFYREKKLCLDTKELASPFFLREVYIQLLNNVERSCTTDACVRESSIVVQFTTPRKKGGEKLFYCFSLNSSKETFILVILKSGAGALYSQTCRGSLVSKLTGFPGNFCNDFLKYQI